MLSSVGGLPFLERWAQPTEEVHNAGLSKMKIMVNHPLTKKETRNKPSKHVFLWSAHPAPWSADHEAWRWGGVAASSAFGAVGGALGYAAVAAAGPVGAVAAIGAAAAAAVSAARRGRFWEGGRSHAHLVN